MNSHPKHKFSDEALSELLASPEEITVENAEAQAMLAALSSYRTETLARAERRSATLPSLAARTKTSRWAAVVPQWSLAAVAVVAVMAGVVRFAGYGGDAAAPDAARVVATSSAQATSEDEIAADNRLLDSIDQALRYNGVSPVAAFEGKSVKQAAPATHTEVTD
jgi:negative regulator of sigma E activity